jgi:hypothetical protein
MEKKQNKNMKIDKKNNQRRTDSEKKIAGKTKRTLI